MKDGSIKIIQPQITQGDKCSVPSCERQPECKNLCKVHYARQKRKGFLFLKIDKTNWSQANIAWLAGMIEGEGCFSLRYYKDKCYCTIKVASTDFDVIDKIYGIVGYGKVAGPYSRNRLNRKPWKSWSLNECTPQIELFEAILPWLCKRRRTRALECLRVLKKNRFNNRNLYV